MYLAAVCQAIPFTHLHRLMCEAVCVRDPSGSSPSLLVLFVLTFVVGYNISFARFSATHSAHLSNQASLQIKLFSALLLSSVLSDFDTFYL